MYGGAYWTMWHQKNKVRQWTSGNGRDVLLLHLGPVLICSHQCQQCFISSSTFYMHSFSVSWWDQGRVQLVQHVDWSRSKRPTWLFARIKNTPRNTKAHIVLRCFKFTQREAWIRTRGPRFQVCQSGLRVWVCQPSARINCGQTRGVGKLCITELNPTNYTTLLKSNMTTRLTMCL